MTNRVIRAKEVVELTGLSLSTISRMERIGKFPKRFKIGKNAVGWSELEISKWFKNLVETNARRTND